MQHIDCINLGLNRMISGIIVPWDRTNFGLTGWAPDWSCPVDLQNTFMSGYNPDWYSPFDRRYNPNWSNPSEHIKGGHGWIQSGFIETVRSHKKRIWPDTIRIDRIRQIVQLSDFTEQYTDLLIFLVLLHPDYVRTRQKPDDVPDNSRQISESGICPLFLAGILHLHITSKWMENNLHRMKKILYCPYSSQYFFHLILCFSLC